MFHSLCYISKANQFFSKQQLNRLAESSKRKNEAQQVSGALIECEGLFIQTLEGDEAVINNILNKIQRDPRHSEVTIVSIDAAPMRRYAHWSMGCFSVPRSMLPAEIFEPNVLHRKIITPAAKQHIERLQEDFYRAHRVAGGRQCFVDMAICPNSA
ncbi:MAG: BLUF domain-containing protein [Neomegalonema sp.]|nr:BLUF domain-containing protein [Neomegalonema sp.]